MNYLDFQRFRMKKPSEAGLSGLLEDEETLGLEEPKYNGVSGISGLSLQMPKSDYAEVATTSPKLATAKKSSGLGLEGQDYLNLGLIAGQGLLDASEAEKARERQERETRRLEDRENSAANKAFIYKAQQDERQNQQQDRAQNLQGLNYLAEQRNAARANARSGAFRSAVARAMRGGK